jgi:hypothetical protein
MDRLLFSEGLGPDAELCNLSSWAVRCGIWARPGFSFLRAINRVGDHDAALLSPRRRRRRVSPQALTFSSLSNEASKCRLRVASLNVLLFCSCICTQCVDWWYCKI